MQLWETQEQESVLTPGFFPVSLKSQLPYEWAQFMVILGLVWDQQLNFSEHVRRLVARANLRNGIMARLARCNWGLDAGITRSTSKALIFSLCRYGLTVFGAGLHHADFARLDTRIANIAARRILGVSRSARLAILHASAETLHHEQRFCPAVRIHVGSDASCSG